jgi:hypothetical protein
MRNITIAPSTFIDHWSDSDTDDERSDSELDVATTSHRQHFDDSLSFTRSASTSYHHLKEFPDEAPLDLDLELPTTPSVPILEPRVVDRVSHVHVWVSGALVCASIALYYYWIQNLGSVQKNQQLVLTLDYVADM